MSIYDKASLVLIPSGTKTSKVYSQKPVSGDGDFTFSRSTMATRVNADGNIEKETQNLLLQSNTFDTTWTTTAANITSGQADKDGGTTAWLLERNGSVNGRVSQSVSTSGLNTLSLYAKSGSFDWLILRFDNLGERYFDLSSGALGGSRTAAPVDSSIEDVGNGWYRCSIVTNGNSANVRIYPAASNLDTTGTNGTIYIQDAQLEQGLVARDYIETTTSAVEGGITDNVPRLDYTDSSCPALLLEPQRTNLIGNSEAINPSVDNTWKQLGSNTFTNNYGTSPEGKQNSTLIEFGGTNSSYQVYYQMNFSAGDYTTSIYAKGSGSFKLGIYDNASILTDTITLTSEWQRFEVTKTAAATSGGRGVWLYPNGDGDTIEVWGGQCEAGSYATSYIPTYGTSVTRNYDLAQMLSLNNTSAAWTLFFDVDLDTCPNYNRNFLELDTSGGSRRASFRWFNGATSNKISPYFDVDGVYPFSTGVAENDTDNGKIVLRHDGNGNFSYFNFRNSVAQKRDYSGTAFTASIIDIFGAADATELESILFFPSALSDEECENLVS